MIIPSWPLYFPAFHHEPVVGKSVSDYLLGSVTSYKVSHRHSIASDCPPTTLAPTERLLNTHLVVPLTWLAQRALRTRQLHGNSSAECCRSYSGR